MTGEQKDTLSPVSQASWAPAAPWSPFSPPRQHPEHRDAQGNSRSCQELFFLHSLGSRTADTGLRGSTPIKSAPLVPALRQCPQKGKEPGEGLSEKVPG